MRADAPVVKGTIERPKRSLGFPVGILGWAKTAFVQFIWAGSERKTALVGPERLQSIVQAVPCPEPPNNA